MSPHAPPAGHAGHRQALRRPGMEFLTILIFHTPSDIF